MVLRGVSLSAVALSLMAAMPVVAATAPQGASANGGDTAALFGAREAISGLALSPDGSKLLYLAADNGAGTALMVTPLDGSSPPRAAVQVDGTPVQLNRCDWADNSRIVCSTYAVADSAYGKLGISRLFAIDPDGKRLMRLEERPSSALQVRVSQFDGGVIDWMEGQSGKLLMARDHIPESTIGTLVAKTADGLGVDSVDTHTMASTKVETADPNASEFMSDGQGTVRMKAMRASLSSGYDVGGTTWFYRKKGDRQWQRFATVTDDDKGLRPLSIDSRLDVVYCLDKKGGRDALFRVSLDGSMLTELVYADPKLDIDNVVRIGRQARVIGVTTAADSDNVTYFDPAYKALATSLGRALPDFPIIQFVSTSADETKLLLFAGSDQDPGRYYLFDRTTKHLNELLLTRPQLEHATLAPMSAISFKAQDGTNIPAYLTLPTNGKKTHVPAIVMPHGGPASHDDWGFDWLVQFYAARGYAVLQPEYRGSAGFGDAWQLQNGFKSWRTAIGDVADAGRWLVTQGIADPDRLAIVGWSYGGYAALETQVVAPDLFKAVVAIAPVTDLGALKDESKSFTNWVSTRDYIGDVDIAGASPARHAAAFKAPVMMFHGDMDLNVAVAETRTMDDRLRAAGRQSEAVIYPGLDHQLSSGRARADMLRRSDAFLRTALHMDD